MRIAFLCAALLSMLIVMIEVSSHAKSSAKASLGLATYLYLCIFLVGNLLSTFLAYQWFVEYITSTTDAAEAARPYVAAMIGVFAFQGIISRMNLTVLEKGVLTLDTWISKARDHAVASAIRKQVAIEEKELIRNSNALKILSETDLNAYIASQTTGSVLKLEQAADENKCSSAHYKALFLASELSQQKIKEIIKCSPAQR